MSRFVLLPLAAVLLAGCASDSSGPTDPTAFTATDLTPSASVSRFEVQGSVFTWDLDRGLLLATGLPAQTTEWEVCPGETGSSEFVSVKQNGQRQIHWNAFDRDATLHLYQVPSDWNGDLLAVVCETLPFAVGTGRIRLLDNDVTNTLERVRTVIFTVQGIVTVVATGEVLRVSATDNTKIYPDGSLVTKAHILLR